MEEARLEQLRKVMQALKSLQKSTARSMQMSMVEGTGKLLIRSYNNLHKQLLELMPDDPIIEPLTLEVDADTTDQQIAGQVQFLTSQLQEYLRDTVRPAPGSPEWNIDFGDLAGEAQRLKSIGREIQEQVMGLTRNTIKRALSNIDVQFGEGGDYRYAYFEHEDLTGRNIPGSDFRKAVLLHTKLTGTNMPNSDLRKCHLEHVNMTGVNLAGSDLRKIVIKDCNLKGVNLDKAELRRAAIYNSNMTGVNLGRAALDGVLLVDCDLEAVNLQGASTRGMTLHNVTLRHAMMPDGRRYHEGMDLSAYGIEVASGPTPPPPPVPPRPAHAAPHPPQRPGFGFPEDKPKRKMKVVIDHNDFDELEEEMDALESEMDDLDAQLDTIHDKISTKSDEARAEIEGRRSELERRRAQIEAELAELDENPDDEA